MTLRPNQIGDKGQRYEIRFAEEGDSAMRPLGWSDELQAAEKMAASWRLKPSVRACIVVDRRALTELDDDIQAQMDRDRE